MAMWKITDKGPVKVSETSLERENILEEQLEDWIVANPDILGESLLIIGRQVLIPDTKDKLDILAIDVQGHAVIVELKRGQLKAPVDIQALRYASYIAKWEFQNFESQAWSFLGKTGDPEFNFKDYLESFYEDAGVEKPSGLNQDQRIFIVGAAVRDKIGSVALWLRDHSIDITVIEVRTYKERDSILIQPATIVPLPVSKFENVGKGMPGGAPWVQDGRRWHLENKCSPMTQELLLRLDDILREFDLDGPRWNQKSFVSYRAGNRNWLVIETGANVLYLHFKVASGSFDDDQLAKKLNIAKFDAAETLSEKLSLPSSVIVTKVNAKVDKVRIIAKKGFDPGAQPFLDFLHDAYESRWT